MRAPVAIECRELLSESRTVKLNGLTDRVLSRIRCLRRTRGLHEIDLATSRCHYCQRDWTALYGPRDSALARAGSPGHREGEAPFGGSRAPSRNTLIFIFTVALAAVYLIVMGLIG